MPDPKEPSWNLTAKQLILGAGSIISVTATLVLGTWKYIGTKADESEVKALTETVATLAEKKDVESLKKAITELDAQRREGILMLTNISDMLKETKAKIVKIEDGQIWQIQQEAKRLQWQQFKQEPPATPPANVGR